ncbi:DNA primase [bacterium]|nr:DNA primase [bacterium]
MPNSLEDVVSQIKDRLDIVEVVSKVVVLKKSGANFWGLCPFHNDKNPSLSVNPQKGIYKCFSCGAGGDALKFIMKTQNKEFMEVVTELAEKFGIEMPQLQSRSAGSEAKALKEEMMKSCEDAAKFYMKRLYDGKESEKAQKILEKRGITKEIIKKFSIGWAENEYTALYDQLKKDYSVDVLEKAGLIIKGNKGDYIDRFRNRIIIPIQNEDGKYVAFGARAVDEGQVPKYLNSADSLIYNKSKILYGLYTAKDAIKTEDSAIIMEGYFDVISTQAHGIENCVASCGTALTPEHVKLISRYTKSRKIFLSFDTDNAGVTATKRSGNIIREVFSTVGAIKQFDDSYSNMSSNNTYSCEIRVISPPEGKDPDEYIRANGADKFRQYIQKAPLLIDFEINLILKEKAETPQEKSQIAEKAIEVLSEINNPIIQSEYTKKVASTLNIDYDVLLQEVRKISNFDLNVPKINIKNVTKSLQLAEKTQKNLLSIYFTNENYLQNDEILQMISSDLFTDETLIIVKSTIDKLIQTVNNVRELTEKLYTNFITDEKISQLITDLIYMSEAFNGLSVEEIKLAIKEMVTKLRRLKIDNEIAELKKEYKSVNDEDTEALKAQIRLKEKIKDWR